MSPADGRADSELLAATRREPQAFGVFYERYRDAEWYVVAPSGKKIDES